MRGASIFSCHIVVISHRIFEVGHKKRIRTEQACFLVYCDPLIDCIFGFSDFARRISIFCCLVETPSVTLAAVFSSIGIKNLHRVEIEVFVQAFVDNMALCRVPVFLPVFICHNQLPFVCHVFLFYFYFINFARFSGREAATA